MEQPFKTSNEYNALMIRDDMYVAVPNQRRGGFDIYSGEGRVFNDRFYRNGEHVESIEEFVSTVQEIRLHRDHLDKLGRIEQSSKAKTPWRTADHVTIYADGVRLYSTPSHGGFKVHKRINDMIPEPYRNADGWYEEDCEWAKVAAGLPHLFTDREKKQAERTLKNTYPDEFEAVNGVIIPESESHVKRERAFHERHANDYLVISASMQDDDPGMLRCTATIGGKRGGYVGGVFEESPEERVFLVPKKEYDTRGSFDFAIDLERHRELQSETSASFTP